MGQNDKPNQKTEAELAAEKAAADKAAAEGKGKRTDESPAAETWKPTKGAAVEVFVAFQGPYPKRCSGTVLEVEKGGRIKARVTMPNGDKQDVTASPRNRFGVGYASAGSR